MNLLPRLSRFALPLLFCLLAAPAWALAVLSGGYKLPAGVDASVSTEMATELWAQVWRPEGPGPYPLVIFLHGNHGTCGRQVGDIRVDDRVDYTYSGTCPSGYVVTPNHRGYDYLAQTLAGYGFVVVSINANRGVTAAPGVSGDQGLNLRRGRLVLRHMQQLAEWNRDGGAPESLGFDLVGLLDFSQVGLMGHSRGGEGVRAAVAQYRDGGSPWPARIGPVGFKAVYEIGPVDGQTSRVLNATSVDWNVLLPACDGDVYDLQGVKPFDRMLAITNEKRPYRKSTFQVFGANHNFYNTEWQESDAWSCQGQTPLFPQTGGSAPQRLTAKQTLIPFFRASLGADANPRLAQRFDPSVPLPATLDQVTDYARGYSAGPRAALNYVLDNFDQATGTSSRGLANQWARLDTYSHGGIGDSHDYGQRAARVVWSRTGAYLQIHGAPTGETFSADGYRALEFRVAVSCDTTPCGDMPAADGDVDFSIALIHGNAGMSAPIDLKSRAVVRRPVGTYVENTLFQTVRIPLDAFAGADLTRLRGVRFSFDRMPAGSVYLGNVRLTKAAARDTLVATGAPPAGGALPAPAADDRNRVVAVRPVAGAARAGMEIELQSSRRFPVGGALPVLSIGGREFRLSRFPDGATDRLVFSLEADRYAALDDGGDIVLRIGGAPAWHFGAWRGTGE